MSKTTSDTVKVEFAYPYTDADGKNHNADATASLPREEAKNLIHFGRARAATGSSSESSGPAARRRRAAKKTAAKQVAAPQAPVADTTEEK